MSGKTNWDTELYEARHSFVWQFGKGVIELLAPKSGERILDLGCGTGHLTSQIAQSDARVIGLDSSPDMIGQARQNYPALSFMLADAAAMPFKEEFDAVFSNAAIHWMPDQAQVAERVSRALKRGGRLVAELGGKGNIRHIEEAIHSVLPRYCGAAMPATRTRFSSISEFAGLLEAESLEVRTALLFDRPTPLEGENGMENWLLQFAAYYFEPLAREARVEALREIVEHLRPVLQQRDGRWFADYRRLRIVAVKL